MRRRYDLRLILDLIDSRLRARTQWERDWRVGLLVGWLS